MAEALVPVDLEALAHHLGTETGITTQDLIEFVMNIDSHQEISFTRELVERLRQITSQFDENN